MSDWKQTLTVIGIVVVGFGFVGNEMSGLRAELRENNAVLQSGIDGLRDDVTELSLSVARLEVRVEHIERRLDDVEQGLDDVEQGLGRVEQHLGIIAAPAAE